MSWAMTVRELRKRLGWTQEQLAATLDVSFPTVNRWERSKFEPSRMGKRLLRALLAERSLVRCSNCGAVFELKGIALDLCVACLDEKSRAMERVAREILENKS